MSLHRNTITSQELKDREELVRSFQEALADLIYEYSEEADEIGGEFRGPGIKAELDRVLKGVSLQREISS